MTCEYLGYHGNKIWAGMQISHVRRNKIAGEDKKANKHFLNFMNQVVKFLPSSYYHLAHTE